MGFLQGFIYGLTNDESVYDDKNSYSGNVIGDFLGGAVGGLVREAGSAFLSKLADDEEDQNWLNWVNSFEDEVDADSVYFEVRHKGGHDECTLIATIFDEDDNVIAQKSWEVEYDKEIKQLHKQVYKIHHENDALEDADNDITIVEGDLETAEELFELFDDFFQLDIDEIFDIDSISFDMENVSKVPTPTLSDRHRKIRFNFGDTYLDDEEGTVFFQYFGSGKVFTFIFAVNNTGCGFRVELSKKNKIISAFEAESPSADYAVWEMIDDIEELGVDVPEDFTDHLQEFIQELADISLELSSDT